MAADAHEPESEPGPQESAPGVNPALQQLLVTSLVAAIILMIALGAFWTSF